MMAQNVVAFIEPEAEARANDFLIRLITVSNGQQQQQGGEEGEGCVDRRSCLDSPWSLRIEALLESFANRFTRPKIQTMFTHSKCSTKGMRKGGRDGAVGVWEGHMHCLSYYALAL